MTAILLACALMVQAKKEPDRVGRIVIEGNTATPSDLILRQLEMFPGQILRYPQLGAASKSLARLGLFDSADPPAVEVVPNEFDNQFKDIRVRVKERPGNWVFFAAIDCVEGVLTFDVQNLRDTALRVMREVNGKQ